MSTNPEPPVKPQGAAVAPTDPSMEDILASIRRILNEDETAAASPQRGEEVLVLDSSMMVSDPKQAGATAVSSAPQAVAPVGTAEPASETRGPSGPTGDETAREGRLVAPAAAAAAAAAVGSLVRRLATERGAAVHRGGPTIEDLVREEIRPLLKAWLDANLPGLVERLVREEIERVVGRIAP
jgi:cell pole-organizing protein PopZ